MKALLPFGVIHGRAGGAGRVGVDGWKDFMQLWCCELLSSWYRRVEFGGCGFLFSGKGAFVLGGVE